MTYKYLKSLLENLNKDQADTLYLRPLSPLVSISKVWTKVSNSVKGFPRLIGPYNIYFIINEEGVYIANVVDMRSDLHWFVDNDFRGNGYLTKALKETILCHLFQDRLSKEFPSSGMRSVKRILMHQKK